jgi:hypothetical protein
MKTLYQASPEELISWLLDDSGVGLGAFGREQGFNERADVVRAADGTDLNEFWNEVNRTLAIRNADKSTLISRFTYGVVDISSEVVVPSEAEFEKASEFGQPAGIKGGATRFFRGYDFDFYDLAIRYTWMFLAEVDLAQLRMNHNLALEADLKLQFRKVFQRLFNPINTSGFLDDNTPITVYAAYNGDGEVPPKFGTNTFTGSHNHYLVSGNTGITSANVDRLAEELGHHGYNLQGGYQLVLWVNKQEADRIKTFRVASGALFDFVPNPALNGGKIWVPTDGRYEGGPSGTVPGEIGTYGPFHIVEEQYIPAGYAVAVATGGTDRLTNPIGFRQHSNPDYRGLKIIPGANATYPLMNSFYRRGLGTGVRQRGGFAIMQIKASGNYQIPAVYDPIND